MLKFSIKNIAQYKVLISCLLLFVIPFFWYLDSSYISYGGDSSRFYLNYPSSWLNNYSLNILNHGFSLDPFHGNNMMIYQLLIYKVLNYLYSDLVSLLHNSFILVTAFLGFYLNIRETISKYLNKHNLNLAIILSFAFATSQVFSWSIFNNGGLWIYVYSGLPLLIYFFFKFIFEGKISTLIFFIFLMWTFSSIFLYQLLPFTIPLTILILIIYYPRIKKEFKLDHFINFIIIFLIIISFNINNFYSIYFEFTNKSNLFLDNTITDRLSGVKNLFSLAGDNFYPLLNLKNIDLGYRTNDPYTISNISFLKYSIILGLIFPLSIFISLLSKKNLPKYSSVNIHTFLTIVLLIFYFLINMNFNEITHSFFLFIFENIPFFHMFRSYPHKFSFSFVFIYMAYIYFILSIIDFNQKFILRIILISITFTVLVQSYPLISGNIYNLKLWMVDGEYHNKSDLNEDYKKAIKEIPKNDNGNIITLPFTNEYWIEIKNNDYAYIGPSPGPLLSDRKDFYGVATKELYDLLLEKNEIEIKKYFEKNNISYIIVNKKDLSDFQYYIKGDYNRQLNLLESLFKILDLSDIYENNTYLLKSINKDSQCIHSTFIRPTIYELKSYCEDNSNKKINDFKKSLDDYQNFELYNFQNNMIFNFLSLKLLNPFYGKNDFTKIEDETKFYMVYKNQFISDLLIILSIIIPFLSIFFILIKKIVK